MKNLIEIIKTIIPFTTILALIYWLIGFVATLPINSDIVLKMAILLGLIPLSVSLLYTSRGLMMMYCG